MNHPCSSEDESPLLMILPLIQRLVYSGIDRKAFPFSRTQTTIFAALAVRQVLTMKEVADYISSSKEQATRAIAPMVDAGYVERFANPANRVHVYVRLTSEGWSYLNHMNELVQHDVDNRLAAALTAEDARELRASLGRVIDILKKVP